MQPKRPPKLDTVGRIADRYGVALHRVQYVVRAKGITPTATAGRLRLFDSEAVARIRYELNLMDARRSGEGRS